MRRTIGFLIALRYKSRIKGRSRMKNREKLRQMTDEELAYYICHKIGISCAVCPSVSTCGWGAGTANGLVKWLRAEAEEEE